VIVPVTPYVTLSVVDNIAITGSLLTPNFFVLNYVDLSSFRSARSAKGTLFPIDPNYFEGNIPILHGKILRFYLCFATIIYLIPSCVA
jgi:hypothetical protein